MTRIKSITGKFALSKLCKFLVGDLRARSIILFGSMARDDFRDSSDIDLLLVTSRDIKPREVEKMIPKSLLPDESISLSIYSEARFCSAYRKGSLFFAHLINEGKVLYDDGFYKHLRQEAFEPSRKKMKTTLKALKQKLEIATDLQKYNNLYIGVLADFFSISKILTYNVLAMNGAVVFGKKKAFSRLAETYPRYKEEICKLYSLEPFFLRNVKGIPEPLPFRPYDCEEKVIEMRESLKRILVGVAENS